MIKIFNVLIKLYMIVVYNNEIKYVVLEDFGYIDDLRRLMINMVIDKLKSFFFQFDTNQFLVQFN